MVTERILVDRHYSEPVEGIVCPICGAKLYVSSAEQCSKADNGDWVADEINLDCESEPSWDSPEWEVWFRWHYQTSYTDWLLIYEKLLGEFRNKYRFNVD